MALTWDTSLSTGVVSVDRQHMRLFDLLNGLIDAMKQGRGKEEIRGVLTDLQKYAVDHFASEESCMHQYKCPAAAQNKAAHAQFVRIFADFQHRFEERGATTSMVLEVEKVLGEWIREHIGRIDRQLGPCARRLAS